MTDIGETLRALRRSRGMTQGTLARLAGTTPKTVSEIETGKRLTPNQGTLASFDAALDSDGRLGQVADLMAAHGRAGRDRFVLAALAELRDELAELRALLAKRDLPAWARELLDLAENMSETERESLLRIARHLGDDDE